MTFKMFMILSLFIIFLSLSFFPSISNISKNRNLGYFSYMI